MNSVCLSYPPECQEQRDGRAANQEKRGSTGILHKPLAWQEEARNPGSNGKHRPFRQNSSGVLIDGVPAVFGCKCRLDTEAVVVIHGNRPANQRNTERQDQENTDDKENWHEGHSTSMESNDEGERPPPTVTVERTKRRRISVQRRTEARGGGSSPPTC